MTGGLINAVVGGCVTLALGIVCSKILREVAEEFKSQKPIHDQKVVGTAGERTLTLVTQNLNLVKGMGVSELEGKIPQNTKITAVTGTGTGETQVLTLSHALKGDIAANDEKQPSFTYESFEELVKRRLADDEFGKNIKSTFI